MTKNELLFWTCTAVASMIVGAAIDPDTTLADVGIVSAAWVVILSGTHAWGRA